MSDLPALLARVRAATGPDRKLDLDIGMALAGFPGAIGAAATISTRDGGLSWQTTDGPPRYTASLDAVVALIESRMPGWTWALYADPVLAGGRAARAYLWSAERTRRGRGWPKHNREAVADTPALALLDCALQAEIAKGGRE